MLFLDNYPGTLKINVKEALIYRDTDVFGKMDPYVVVSTKKSGKFQTSTAQDAGKQPTWNEVFEIQMGSKYEDVAISIYDEDWLTDDLIAQS